MTCECGCGRLTTVYYGQPRRFVHGHNNCVDLRPEYVVDGNGCWVWQRARFADGYGERDIAGKTMRAHRRAYEQAYGSLPAHLEVHHRCGVKLCVNPEHLEAITRVEHGRLHAPKLTMERAREIRGRLARGERGVDLAAEFGVSKVTITGVKQERIWREAA